MTSTPPRADRPRGTRSRAGNAMDRTRAAVVRGVEECVVAHGVRRTTMIDIAAAAGIAKGTLYNHVRTKGEALQLYAESEVARLADLLVEGGLEALGTTVAAHPVAARLRTDEPAALAALLLGAGDHRDRSLEVLEDVLGPVVAPLAWRWLLSLVADPGSADERTAAVAAFTALGAAASETPAAAVVTTAADGATPAADVP